jgi:hypothetical protein
MIELVQERGGRMRELVDAPLERSTLRSVNEPGPALSSSVPIWRGTSSTTMGRRIQSRVLKELKRHLSLVSTFVRIAPTSARSSVEDATKTLRDIADRSHLAWHETIEKARIAAHPLLPLAGKRSNGVGDPSDGQPHLGSSRRRSTRSIRRSTRSSRSSS